mmetsp:Transcript_24839/g.71253  ORF Transcript_24839/g.71253 Transcript_24839/m.71253 type:complete len:208 (+) Transcript_24839:545-1168(+)
MSNFPGVVSPEHNTSITSWKLWGKNEQESSARDWFCFGCMDPFWLGEFPGSKMGASTGSEEAFAFSAFGAFWPRGLLLPAPTRFPGFCCDSFDCAVILFSCTPLLCFPAEALPGPFETASAKDPNFFGAPVFPSCDELSSMDSWLSFFDTVDGFFAIEAQDDDALAPFTSFFSSIGWVCCFMDFSFDPFALLFSVLSVFPFAILALC